MDWTLFAIVLTAMGAAWRPGSVLGVLAVAGLSALPAGGLALLVDAVPPRVVQPVLHAAQGLLPLVTG